jgi:preprotein translocase subunit SecG
MYIFFSVLVIIVCIILIMIVLVQNSKGGGLAANFTSSGQSMGVRKTADFLEKSTWTLAVSLLVLTLLATATIPRQAKEERDTKVREQINTAVDPGSIPTFPMEGSQE